MVDKIHRDQGRFRDIVRGKIRDNLRKYLSNGDLIGRKGKQLVSIPLPQLDIPHFRYGDNGRGGVGQGDGEIGRPIARGEGESGPGPAGAEPGEHLLEVDITLDELAALLGESLGLPQIEPKGKNRLERQKTKYSTVRRVGPESLRHFKRTYVAALRRQLVDGTYQPDAPCVLPIRDDRRYRSWRSTPEPDANALIIYMMDVSGSMGDEQKAVVRTCAFWIDTWLRSKYRGVERRFIIHDAAAKVVDETTFFQTRESGGTRISSAYHVAAGLLDGPFPHEDWNIYCFQFSDGDNWGEDSKEALRLLDQSLLPRCNLFCYGQVESPYGSGEFLRALDARFPAGADNLVTTEIEGKEGICDAIREFLGTGR
ncbi:MAG: DUF444 family protein [Planctomycetes bacterium]|nr:DUF444 family protein [Planctomycetota bacterium]